MGSRSLQKSGENDAVTFQDLKLLMLLRRLAKRTLFSTAVAIKLEFDGPNFSIEWSIGTMWKHKVVGETKNLRSIDVVEEKVQVWAHYSVIYAWLHDSASP